MLRCAAPRNMNKDCVADIQPKVLLDQLSKWTLTSLTIGPQVQETNTEFWEESFKDLPPLPRVDSVTIIYHYPRLRAFNTYCWEYFDRLLIRRDLFPALKSVHIRASCGSYELIPRRWWAVHSALRGIRARGLGPRKSPTFERYQRANPLCAKDRC